MRRAWVPPRAGRPGPPRRGAAPAPTLALSLWDTCGGEGVMTQVVTYRESRECPSA